MIDNILLAFITDKKVIGFYEYLSNINLEISNLSTDNSLSQSLFCRQITSFMNLMKENDYSRHHLMHAPYVIEQFALFVDMFHLPICYETINLFCLDILKNLISSYKESRTLLYRYFDYINGKPINFNSCYCFNVLRGQDKILMIILTIVRDWDTKKILWKWMPTLYYALHYIWIKQELTVSIKSRLIFCAISKTGTIIPP